MTIKWMLAAGVMLLVNVGLADAREASEEEARTIVTQKLVEDGFLKLPPWKVRPHETPANECLEFLDAKRQTEVKKMLVGRRYFSFLYFPEEGAAGGPIFGGPICLFFDRESKQLIALPP